MWLNLSFQHHIYSIFSLLILPSNFSLFWLFLLKLYSFWYFLLFVTCASPHEANCILHCSYNNYLTTSITYLVDSSDHKNTEQLMWLYYSVLALHISAAVNEPIIKIISITEESIPVHYSEWFWLSTFMFWTFIMYFLKMWYFDFSKWFYWSFKLF